MSESKKIILALANKRLTSFRRAGITVGHEPVVITMPPVTDEQLKALQDEPNIKVTFEESGTKELKPQNPSSDSNESNDEPNADSKAESITAEDLIAHIVQLDPDNKELWTNGGKPQAKALAESCGQEVSAALRDEAFALLESQKAGAVNGGDQ